ncbi:MAG: beta-glucosidase [Deltaproteobacteria bacterium]|nr:beta-glucosidase [Deltaproteobacteria bacterium]
MAILNHFCFVLAFFLAVCFPAAGSLRAADFTPDSDYLQDRAALEELQRDCFRYMWEFGDPASGMAYEANFNWDTVPVAVGGTGFGIAAVVVASDRGWISREEAVQRLLKIALFLRDKTPRADLHGAFPHWLNGNTGAIISFGKNDEGADIVETSLLMQGLLIARAYFNGPGAERELRSIITGLWEEVDWNWFTNGKNNGLYWQWSAKGGFPPELKILGFNECMITYVLALSSPTHPISRQDYDFWTSGRGYQPKELYGYRVEAALPGGGPLFLTQYSFIGADPRRMADEFVPGGYFARNVKHVLSNRGYCLQSAPAGNRYSAGYWGLTASQIKNGYAAGEPKNDPGAIGPTGALASMPYTPFYSMQVLRNLRGGLKEKVWGPYGPYDAFSLRDDWVSDRYLAIDQLPIVCMVENYRSGLLWRLFMSVPDIRAGLRLAGVVEPKFASGFPEAVVTQKKGNRYVPDACDLLRHPDSGEYSVPYWSEEAGAVFFSITDTNGVQLYAEQRQAAPGRNYLDFPMFRPADGETLILIMRDAQGEEHRLPVRLN